MLWAESVFQMASAVLQAILALLAAWERTAGWVAGAAEGIILGLAVTVAASWDEGWRPRASSTKLAPAPTLETPSAPPPQTLPAAAEVQHAEVQQPAVPSAEGHLLDSQAAPLPAARRPSKLVAAGAPVRGAKREARQILAWQQSGGLGCLSYAVQLQATVPARLPCNAHLLPHPVHPAAAPCPEFSAAPAGAQHGRHSTPGSSPCAGAIGPSATGCAERGSGAAEGRRSGGRHPRARYRLPPWRQVRGAQFLGGY